MIFLIYSYTFFKNIITINYYQLLLGTYIKFKFYAELLYMSMAKHIS